MSAVALVHVVAGVDLAPPCGDLGLDAIDVVVDVDAVGHGLLVGVFHHQVLVEEAEGLLDGRGGEADQIGVEVLQHLPPEVVDGAVAFVGDDDVEGLDREWPGCSRSGSGFFEQRSPDPRTERSSSSSASSCPLSIEYRRWMVLMQTRAVVSSVLRGQVLDDVLLGELDSCCRARRTAGTL